MRRRRRGKKKMEEEEKIIMIKVERKKKEEPQTSAEIAITYLASKIINPPKLGSVFFWLPKKRHSVSVSQM